MNHPHSQLSIQAKNYFFILIPSPIVAIAFNTLLLPNHIPPAGVSAISTIIQSCPCQPAYLHSGLNIPLFIPAFYLLAPTFRLKTLVRS
ncbi:YitT family protein, partial [Bacillus pumilus]|uniref:YitT family protein n=1 Tax=Bacillus pumilus TaxID=1408 RepID=UPI0011A54977